MAPPKVLPAVATAITRQNQSGCNCTSPKTTGSDPIGNKVADISETANTVLSPNSGSESHCNKE